MTRVYTNKTVLILAFCLTMFVSCEKEENTYETVITVVSSIDADNDGIDSSEDCNDNDASVVTSIGQICDDGNAQTINDSINSNCICIGEIIDVPVLTNTAILTSSIWVLTDYYLINANGTEENLMYLMPDCKRDDQYNFGLDNVMVVTEGNTSCSVGDPYVIFNDTWGFANDETLLIVGEFSRNIEHLSSAEMTLSHYGEVGETYFLVYTAF